MQEPIYERIYDCRSVIRENAIAYLEPKESERLLEIDTRDGIEGLYWKPNGILHRRIWNGITFSDRHEINVTEDDISHGIAQDCGNCPITIAARREFDTELVFDRAYLIFIDGEAFLPIPADEMILKWVVDFDSGKPVNPIQIVMEKTSKQTIGRDYRLKMDTYPDGWDENRVESVIDHYEGQTEEEAVIEDRICKNIFR